MDNETNALRRFLGVRDWLYFVAGGCLPPDEPYAMVRVDRVTDDVEYFRYNSWPIDDTGMWERVADGYMLDVGEERNDQLLSNAWIIELIDAHYGR